MGMIIGPIKKKYREALLRAVNDEFYECMQRTDDPTERAILLTERNRIFHFWGYDRITLTQAFAEMHRRYK